MYFHSNLQEQYIKYCKQNISLQFNDVSIVLLVKSFNYIVSDKYTSA